MCTFEKDGRTYFIIFCNHILFSVGPAFLLGKSSLSNAPANHCFACGCAKVNLFKGSAKTSNSLRAASPPIWRTSIRHRRGPYCFMAASMLIVSSAGSSCFWTKALCSALDRLLKGKEEISDPKICRCPLWQNIRCVKAIQGELKKLLNVWDPDYTMEVAGYHLLCKLDTASSNFRIECVIHCTLRISLQVFGKELNRLTGH